MPERIFLDADILIWHLRAKPEAYALIRSLGNRPDRLLIAAIQRLEVTIRLRPDERERAYRLLGFFETEPLTAEIVDLGVSYYNRWNPSHGTDEGDALLAATVRLTGGRIVTQNIRHFPMPDITVEHGWGPASNH